VREDLRPVERLVLRLVDEGVGDVEIARRFRRSPEMIRRITVMARLPRTAGLRTVPDDGLRPLERRLLRWRHYGATYAEIGSRFHRGPAFVAQVEALARYKLEEQSANGSSVAPRHPSHAPLLGARNSSPAPGDPQVR
jgi:DNA-binding CsgD family transcriptional regulator